MSLLVVGSVAYDGIETPFGKKDRILGGSATYISLTASYFAKQVNLVGVVGKDFDKRDIELFRSRGINLKGLQHDESEIGRASCREREWSAGCDESYEWI